MVPRTPSSCSVSQRHPEAQGGQPSKLPGQKRLHVPCIPPSGNSGQGSSFPFSARLGTTFPAVPSHYHSVCDLGSHPLSTPSPPSSWWRPHLWAPGSLTFSSLCLVNSPSCPHLPLCHPSELVSKHLKSSLFTKKKKTQFSLVSLQSRFLNHCHVAAS